MNDESEMKIKTKKFVSKQFKSSIKLQSSNSIYLRLVRWELTRMYSHFSCLIDYCCCTKSTSTASQHYYSLLYTTTGKLLELWLGLTVKGANAKRLRVNSESKHEGGGSNNSISQSWFEKLWTFHWLKGWPDIGSDYSPLLSCCYYCYCWKALKAAASTTPLLLIMPLPQMLPITPNSSYLAEEAAVWAWTVAKLYWLGWASKCCWPGYCSNYCC